MATMPPGGQVPPEPALWQCSNPVECAEADTMVAWFKGYQWEYDAYSMDPATPDKIIRITAYTPSMYVAYKRKMFGAFPPPGFENGQYINPANATIIYRRPT